MKKKWMILFVAILGIAGIVLASQVDAWVSAPCPYCGATNAIHITNGDCIKMSPVQYRAHYQDKIS